MHIELPVPGFVDLQVNGYLGVDFSSPSLSEEACLHACRELLRSGTAAFLPTIITSPLEVYRRNLPLLAGVIHRSEFQGHLLGIHLEGPFLSAQPGAVGAHNPAWVRATDVGLLYQLNEWARGTIRLVTLAAELEGAEQTARAAIEQGMVVSVGHTLATPGDLERLAKAGATALTHLGNGLPQCLPKFANPIWAGLADDRYTAMLIGDGHHLPHEALKVMIRAKGVERTVIVSDAAPVAGLPPGRYHTLGNDAVLEPSGRLHNPEKACLVGSSLTLCQCMNYMASLGLWSLEELLAIGFTNPLRLLGLDPVDLPTGPNLSYDTDGRRFIPAPA